MFLEFLVCRGTHRVLYNLWVAIVGPAHANRCKGSHNRIVFLLIWSYFIVSSPVLVVFVSLVFVSPVLLVFDSPVLLVFVSPVLVVFVSPVLVSPVFVPLGVLVVVAAPFVFILALSFELLLSKGLFGAWGGRCRVSNKKRPKAKKKGVRFPLAAQR